MGTEPKRHHYIPQFILRNFCFNESNHLNYYDISNNKFSVEETSNVFMIRNLYRDEVNYPDNPIQLEKDISKYETEIANIIRKKLLLGDDILITQDEDERLKLFLAIMPFRSKSTREQFGKFDDNDKQYYNLLKEGETFEEIWIRNLEKIINCRSLAEVIKNPEIDEIIKMAMKRDSFGIAGKYLIIAERRGNEDFFIGDCYPLITSGEFDGGLKLPMYSYYPISPSRILILAANGVEGTPRNLQDYDADFIRKPVIMPNSNMYRITVRKIYEDEVKMINQSMFDATKAIGGNIAFKDRDRISILN